MALGVTGGIGAYKSVEVCRGLQKRGHDVVAVMTRAATKFVGPLTFEAITRRPVITSQWAPGANADIEHIAIADSISLLLVAPCTANVIGKFANGIADDFLSSLYLATQAAVLIAPAMNSNMLAHDAVQKNLQALSARGVRFVEPGEGYLACGWIGKGRLAEPEEVVAAAVAVLEQSRPADHEGRPRRSGPLAGRRVLVTAGPTYEDIDPVRFVGNRSSGRMGFALAEEARRRGARVTIVAGPTRVEPPAADALVRVRSAAEMHAAVVAEAASADVVIMAAAVADYTPADTAGQKIAKGDAPMTLTLRRTPDILAELGDMRSRLGTATPLLVGFAAETHDVVARAQDKRRRKKLDLIVANDVSRSDRGFEAATNAVTIIGPDDEAEVPLQSKSGVAAAILDRVERLLASSVPTRV
ncbi:MAG TPA: bifunctional phosphopantothenoylcysteine decarboxylase/phosphopantothenate--cysteine ligase CoaBC [Vicinamibacterales bacterium]|nr:bifunctional phosphopantothenoylcysteine decarboxylase/phosphopantothenate--cysteine ligase CoaBC [Vicinamibacterales bacterium]